MKTPTRRRVLAAAGLSGLAAAAGAGIAMATPSDADAELLTACGRYGETFDQLEALIGAQSRQWGACLPEWAYDEQAVMCDRLHEHGDAVRDIAARTVKGVCAKARVVWMDDGALPGREPDTLLFSLLRDLGGDAA